MTINSYFSVIKTVIDRYSATPLVLESNVNFDIRPGEQGYLSGFVNFADGSSLHFKEYVDVEGGAVDKVSYGYHYQGENSQMIFRYDNAAHKPGLAFTNHKHTPNGVDKAEPPELKDVFDEITPLMGDLKSFIAPSIDYYRIIPLDLMRLINSFRFKPQLPVTGKARRPGPVRF